MSQKLGEFKNDCQKIQIDMIDIVEVDVKKQTVKVEPLANMGQITAILGPMGWTLAIVPELDDLTVGGLLMGFGIETSSHKYGLFQDICTSFEVVLASGEVVTASATENVDLFRALPWSHGTLGFLTCAELKIVPAKKYVELTYTPYHSKQAFIDSFRKWSDSEKPDFVECLVYSDTEAVVMTGYLSDGNNKKDQKGRQIQTNPIGLWYKPWFFTHVRDFLKTGETTDRKSVV